MLVCNIFGGPGCGKSTTAAGVFSKLKQNGVNCEYVHEWVKWPVWEDRKMIFDDQLYIFAKQHHMLYTLRNKVDVAICDSPLLLSNIYGKLYKNAIMKNKPHFFNLVDQCFQEFDNINIILERKKDYNPAGRVQTEEEAKHLDDTIRLYLDENGYEYDVIEGNIGSIELISNHIMDVVNERQI